MAKRSADGLFKRGNFWWGWRRFTPGGALERASTKCRDRKAARLVKAEWERLAADPIHYASNQTTLDDGIAMFLLDAKNRGLAAPTLEIYESKCRHIARVLDGTRALRSIVATTWDGYIATREAEGAHPHSIKKELIRGLGLLKAAKRRGLYPHDISTIMPPYRARYVPRTRALTMGELQRLGRELRADRLAHVAFVVATGCRLKESYAAKLEHIDRRSAGGLFVFIDGTKTRRARRTIPIAPPLEPWLDFVVENASETPAGHFFPRWTNARRDILQACARAGIEPCTWNDLRRTNATLLKHAGMSSADVGELLGHVDGRMVETVYGQSTPKSLQLAVRAAFDNSTSTTQGPIDAGPQPRGTIGATSIDEGGLRSRRSEVRILSGAPPNPENKPFDGVRESAGSTPAEALPYRHDTAFPAYPRSAKACDTVATAPSSQIKSPLPGVQASQFPKAERGGGAAECQPTVDLRKGKPPGSAPCARQGGDASASHPTPALTTATVARHAGLCPTLLAEAYRDVMQRRAGR